VIAMRVHKLSFTVKLS